MIRTIFMGTPAFVVPVLRMLNALPYVEVASAFAPPDRPRGRGRQPEPPPVKEAAIQLGIPVYQPPNLRGDATQAQLASLRPDVIVVAAYGRFLPTPVLDLPAHGCLNLHPSLLPRHRGPSPVATAILEGDDTTGVSLMLLDEGMDTGPILAQREYRMAGDETAGDLTATLFDMGSVLLAENLEPWTRGELQAAPQDDASATVSRKLERSDGRVDWRLPAETLARQCRAFAPWPGLYTDWDGSTLKLLEVSAAADAGTADAPPGTVLDTGRGKGLSVVTGRGLLSLWHVQLEGRRAVSGEEFLRGYPDIHGSLLDSAAESVSSGD